MLQVRREKNTE